MRSAKRLSCVALPCVIAVVLSLSIYSPAHTGVISLAATPRQSAQMGLDYLIPSALAWQGTNNCYGCHVQPFAVVAGAVGKSHQLSVDSVSLDALADGMINLDRGQSPDGCWSVNDTISRPVASSILPLWALANYDRAVSSKYRATMASGVECLGAMQTSSGRMTLDYTSTPVLQSNGSSSSYFTMAAKQMYEATGNPAYEQLFEAGREYIHSYSGASTQTRSLILMALKEAGVASNDSTVQALISELRLLQHADGGWGFSDASALSYPYGTGQVVYALRKAGVSASDTTIVKGIGYLVGQQQPDGSWLPINWPGSRPSTFGSTMWATLALIEVGDPITVEITPSLDGLYVADGDYVTINVTASANSYAGVGGASGAAPTAVDHVELYVDGFLVSSQAGSSTSYVWHNNGGQRRNYSLQAVAYDGAGGAYRSTGSSLCKGGYIIRALWADPNPFDSHANEPTVTETTTFHFRLQWLGPMNGLFYIYVFDATGFLQRIPGGINENGYFTTWIDGGAAVDIKIPYGYCPIIAEAWDLTWQSLYGIEIRDTVLMTLGCFPPGQNAKLSGTVLPPTGSTPLAGALVSVTSPSGTKHGSAFTTGAGAFYIGSLSADTTYRVVVTREGYTDSAVVEGLQLSAGEELFNQVYRLGESVTGIDEPGTEESLPDAFSLSDNYPNPFNPSTTIEYSVPSRSQVRLSIFNVVGQKIRTLVDAPRVAGTYSISWDGKTDAGTTSATGVYFYRLEVDHRAEAKKMLLLK